MRHIRYCNGQGVFMSITVGHLYRDTMYFIRNQFSSLLLLSLLTMGITVLLNQILIPTTDQLKIFSKISDDVSRTEQLGLLNLIQNMTPKQQILLLKIAIASTFSALIGNSLLTGGLLTLVKQISASQPTNILRAIGASSPILMRLFFLIFIDTILVQLGILLLIVPGILLAIAVSLSPVIIVVENKDVFSSIRSSAKFAYENLKLVVPAIFFWLLAKAVFLMIIIRLPLLSPTIMTILINGMGNVISSIFLIYLFRLYILLR